jgi:hypothetical protein
MTYKRDDFTGFEFDFFCYTIEFVFLRNFPITIAIWKRNKLVNRVFDIGHCFYGKAV